MRNLFILFFTLIIGSYANAQNTNIKLNPIQLKVETFAHPVVHHVFQQAPITMKTSPITGIFVMKNSRVKRALSFRVKSKSPKLV